MLTPKEEVMVITIPKTIDEAVSELNGLGALLTAKAWHRAALVYAFTRDGQGERTDLTSTVSGGSLPVEGFARLGVVGLRSPTTIRAYRKAWQDAILDGQAVPVEPGDRIELPTREFPDHPDSNGGTERSIRAAIKKGSVTIGDVIGDDAEVLDTLAEQVSRHTGLRAAVRAKIEARQPEQPPESERHWQQVVDEVMAQVGSPALREKVRLLVENRDQLRPMQRDHCSRTLAAVGGEWVQAAAEMRGGVPIGSEKEVTA